MQNSKTLFCVFYIYIHLHKNWRHGPLFFGFGPWPPAVGPAGPSYVTSNFVICKVFYSKINLSWPIKHCLTLIWRPYNFSKSWALSQVLWLYALSSVLLYVGKTTTSSKQNWSEPLSSCPDSAHFFRSRSDSGDHLIYSRKHSNLEILYFQNNSVLLTIFIVCI